MTATRAAPVMAGNSSKLGCRLSTVALALAIRHPRRDHQTSPDASNTQLVSAFARPSK